MAITLERLNSKDINLPFLGSEDIETIEDARTYIRFRMKDAVDCYQQEGAYITDPIALAKWLMRHW